MKNRKLPTSKQFDRIVENAFSSDVKHNFSVDYEIRKEAIQRGTSMKKRNRTIQWKSIGITAAAAAIVAVVPSSIFLMSRNSSQLGPAAQVEEKSEVSQTAEPLTESATESKNTVPEGKVISDHIIQTNQYSYYVTYNPQIDENRSYHQQQLNYIPDDFTEINEPNMKPGYYSPDGGIFESFLYYIPNEVNFAEEVLNVTSVEEYTVDEKEVILLTRGDSLDDGDINHFGRTGYVFFNGTRNYIEFYATDDISDKALENIIAGMSLAPADESEFIWSAPETNLGEGLYVEPKSEALGRDGLNLHNIGDWFCDDYDDGSLLITVDDAWIQHDFSGIYTDATGHEQDFSQYVDATGNIYMDCSWQKKGDGRNEPFYKTEVNQTQHMNVVVVELTYTNKSDIDLTYANSTETCISPSYFTLVDDTPADTLETADGLTAYYKEEVMQNDSGGFFSFYSPAASSKNNIDLLAGESTTVRLAFLVRDDLLGNLYLDMNQMSWKALTADNSYKSPIIDLCDIKER